MKNKALIILAVVLILLIAAAAVLYNALSGQFQTDALATLPTQTEPSQTPSEDPTPTDTTAAPDYSAPDFTVTDQEGNSVRLSDFEGKPVILNFWASWCGPCKMEMPDFQEAYLEYGDRIHFVMVNTDTSPETAAAFLAEQGYTFPVYYDTQFSASMAYGVSGIPVTYFIDAKGDLIAWGQGMLDPDSIALGISMILPE